MITTRTLFILGAGASKPYGFPIARTLYDQIAAGEFELAPDDFGRTTLTKLRTTMKQAFCSALRDCGMTSVDRFLEYRRDFEAVGKYAIASVLIKKEQPETLFRAVPAEDWYRRIFSSMASPLNDFHRNQVAFVTFNYDRSLEHFLTSALASLHGGDAPAAMEVARKLRIVHLYGTLGDYFEQTPLFRVYNPLPHPAFIDRAAKSIRISTHETVENGRFSALDELFEWAQRVVILGVGFTDHENIRRLGLQRLAPARPLLATRLGLTDLECSTAIAIAERRIAWADKDDDCLMLLRTRIEL